MTPRERRNLLISRMDELENAGLDCKGCQGHCCTFEANSMMVTPIEALELIEYLRNHQLSDEALKEKCLQTIQKYRLNHPLGNGKKSFLRRTYTCPFFNFKELGCPLPREVKPFGCLAFNAHHAEFKGGEHCYSEKELLLKREDLCADENDLNNKLKEKMKITWDKTPLPLALIDLWETKIHL